MLLSPYHQLAKLSSHHSVTLVIIISNVVTVRGREGPNLDLVKLLGVSLPAAGTTTTYIRHMLPSKVTGLPAFGTLFLF